MGRTTLAALVVGMRFLFGSMPVGAQTPKIDFHPLGWVDLGPRTEVALDAGLGFGDGFFAFVPNLSFQYGFTPDLAAGLEWGFSVVDPDHGDGDAWISGLGFLLRARHCQEGQMEICFGTESKIGINPYNVEDLDGGEVLAAAMGVSVPMMEWNHYLPESVILSPRLAVSASTPVFFLQANLGPTLIIPLDHTGETDGDRDVEAALAWGFDLGLRAAGGLDLFFGFMGFSTLTLRDDDTFAALVLGGALLVGNLRPYLRLTIPLDDVYSEGFDLNLSLGLALAF